MLFLKADYNNDSCNHNDDELKRFDKYFHLGRFPPVVHFPFENNSVVGIYQLPLLPPTASKACLKFEIQRTCEYLHLLAVHEKACASVMSSRCSQVGKGIQVFAFRVKPRRERG